MDALPQTVTFPLEPDRVGIFAELLRKAFLEIRVLCRRGAAEQAGELADVMHNVPSRLFDRTLDVVRFREDLEKYQQKYPYPQKSLFPFLDILDSV